MSKGKPDLVADWLADHPDKRLIPHEVVLRDFMQDPAFAWRWRLSWPRRKLLWIRGAIKQLLCRVGLHRRVRVALSLAWYRCRWCNEPWHDPNYITHYVRTSNQVREG